jgi:Zn-dependent protease
MGSVHHMRDRRAVRPSPVFLVICAATVLCGLIAWRYGEITMSVLQTKFAAGRLAVFGFVISGWVLSLCLHEFGHAYLAYRAGDHSVATRGYLTLNPAKYTDPLLSFAIPVLFILLGGIGLPGGAVWIDRSRIQGRWRHSLVSAAGPLSNVLLAIMLAVLYRNFSDGEHGIFWSGVAFLAFLQVTAALLNLLPIPGLDGFGIVEPFLPPRWVNQVSAYGGYMFLLVIALLWVGPINRAFFGLVTRITDTIGLNEPIIQIGHAVFQFWKALVF